VAQVRRWLPLAVATLATVLVAGGFGIAADELATPHPQAAPQLKTVPAATLSRLGMRLAAPAQPLYCGVAGTAVSHGWLRSGAAGCAISQGAAESATKQGGTTRVLESVLARVTSSRTPVVTSDLLAWVVVTQQTVPPTCMPGFGGYQVCVGPRGGFMWSQLVVVDAHTAAIVNQVRVSPAGGGRIRPVFPQPGLIVGGS